jgi:glutaredoxin-like YruB-family protein
MVNVKIYSTPTCPHCIAAKEFFKDNKIEFENIDVSENEDAGKEMQEKSGGTAVPVIDIDGEIIIGFDEEKIKAKLNIK